MNELVEEVMNPWIWILAIFSVAFLILVFLRRRTNEGFAEFKDSNVRFADRQYTYFKDFLKRGMPVNNGINLGYLNAAVAEPNLYNTIPTNQDFTKYFMPDPYQEYFDYDKSFCKPARNPRQLPNRDPTKRTQCGWWYVPDASIPSVGALGTRQEPIVREGLPGGGQWIWDSNRAIELEDKKACKRIKMCDLIDLPGISGSCGFCERRGYAVPINTNGTEKYPDGSDACGEKTVNTSDKCFKPKPPALITDDGINCGNYGRASSDGALRLYTQRECNQLNGNFVPNGECLIKKGGSYSAQCALLNTPPPSAPKPVCAPDAKGNLTRECLLSLAKGLGFNSAGGVIRMIAGGTGPNETDRYAIDTLKSVGITIPDAVLGVGNIDKDSAARIYSDLYNAMNSGYSNLTRQAAKWLVSGTDSFDICDFDPKKTGPFPLNCLQREFRQAGCQPAGAAHPTPQNSGSLQGSKWEDITKRFKNLYASMRSTDSEVQAKATKDCLGVSFYKEPDQQCCYMMYGPWISGTIKVQTINKINDGTTVYIAYDAPYTKMVTQNGEVRYYSGLHTQFNPNNWTNYTLAPRKMYNVRRGTPQECSG